MPNSFMKRYYEEHKNDEGYLKKVNWISIDGIKEFTTLEKNISIEEFVNSFSYYVSNKKEINREELCDYLKYIKQKDHTQYYEGCPISRSGQCASSLIDIPESMYQDIMPCQKCEYKGKDYMTCTKRVKDLNIPDNAVIRGYNRNNDGFIDKIKYEINGEVKSVTLKALETKKETAKRIVLNTGTIFDLWINNNCSIATFKDVKNDRFVRITKDPLTQKKKYGKVYGKLSSDQYCFRGDSMEIYYADDDRWILVWKM